MPINVHWLFGCLKLEPTLFYSRLYQLTKHFELIGVLRCCVVPLAVLDILQLLICRDLMIRLQLNLPFRQQQVKDLVSILSALVTSNPYFSGSLLPKGHEIGFLLFCTHSADATIRSSSEPELSEQSTKLTFFWKLLLFCSYGLASPVIL